MVNHQNRNWRARMQASADQWMSTWALPAGPVGLVTVEQVRQLLRTAYLAGYTDGRKPRP